MQMKGNFKDFDISFLKRLSLKDGAATLTNFTGNIIGAYIADYFAKSLKLKIKIAKNNSKDFKPETSYLRLSNYKARKVLKWHPRWSLNKSLNKILEWNNNPKSKDYKKMCENQIRNYLS